MTALGAFCGGIGSGGGTGAPPPPTGLDNQTVVSSAVGTTLNGNRQRGFYTGFGTITDGTSNLYAGAAITELYWDENGGAPSDFVSLKITGASLANSGWTQMAVDTYIYSRSSATYSTSGGFTTWRWTNPGTQPFGGAGSSHDVVFT